MNCKHLYSKASYGINMRKQILILPLIFIFLITIVSAQYSGSYSQQGAEYFTSGLVINLVYPHEAHINETLTLFGSAYGFDGKLKDIDDIECIIGIVSPHGDRLLLLNESVMSTAYDDKIIIAEINGTFLYELGYYQFNANCEEGIRGGYFSGEILIEQKPEDKHNDEANGILIAIILIPLLVALLLIIGAGLLGEAHAVLRFISYLLVLPFSWVSFHFGMLGLVKYNALTELQVGVGNMVYWTGWLFFVMIFYIIIYLVYVAFQVAAQKRKARLEL